jgi:putative transposase
LIPEAERVRAVQLVLEAVTAGARKFLACETLGVDLRTVQRWQSGLLSDRRKGAVKTMPKKLSKAEEDQIVNVMCDEKYRDWHPWAIVADLAEKGVYLASESTFYRILRAKSMLNHRAASRAPVNRNRPPELVADGPNQVWCWDITYLKSPVSGIWYFAYVIIDIWSRKIVGWTISDVESARVAEELFSRIAARLNVSGVRLHADNGSAMKAATFIMLLYRLGIMPSFSRPRTSDDNPFIESFFKTVKYSAGYPKYFTDIGHAEQWFADFIHWYNNVHRHSGIGYVTPQSRYDGTAQAVQDSRNATYAKAYEQKRLRFSRKPKFWGSPRTVVLNPALAKSVGTVVNPAA